MKLVARAYRPFSRLVRSPGRAVTLARLAHLPLLVLSAAFALGWPSLSQAVRLLVLQSGDSARVTVTLDALRARTSMPVEVMMLPANHDPGLESSLARDRDAVLVALGPRASDFAARLPKTGPVVHCLAGPDALRTGLPAVPSDAPFDQQAQWLAKLVPAARTVAVLFDPSVNTRRAEALGAALSDAGYRMLLRPVGAPSALPAALEAIAGRADVLIALPDATVYTRESARGILLFSFRKRIPLVGPNDAWVKMGALYALDWDYGEVGAICAALAERELRDPKNQAPLAPPRPRVTVNLRSASQFGLNWNRETLRGVDQRHE